MPALQPNSVSTDSARAVGGSFRDPGGLVYLREDVVFRQVHAAAVADYDLLITSGLYAALADAGELVRHEEVDVSLAFDSRAIRVVRPTPITFVSHPYEWCFGQLKDAALLTLRLQKTAMRFGMSLKDATAYNVQFEHGRPIWIDTLSFEVLRPDRPWVAYRQFCEFFVASLALIAHTDARLHQMLRTFLDGIPLEIASVLLPWWTRLTMSLGVHIHLHAAAQRRLAGSRKRTSRAFGQTALAALIDSLERTVRGLTWQPEGTAWGDYYADTNYSAAAVADKRRIVDSAIDRLRPATVWDLGANDGTFSRVAASRGIKTIAFDLDPAAVEKNYRRVRERHEPNLLPLMLDLTNPSAACGWAHAERQSLTDRGPADLVLALALVHHLAIGHNVPFDRIAAFFALLARALVIEFVPKTDSQVERMLASRDDVFAEYTQEAFEAAFARCFIVDAATPIANSQRTLYVMRRKQ